MAARPAALIDDRAAETVGILLGTDRPISVAFENVGDAAGFQPFVALQLPVGVTLASGASYLGHPVAIQLLSVDASGTLSFSVAGQNFQRTGLAPGSTLAVMQPPFGSFTPGQTPAAIDVALHLDEAAPLGASLGVVATAGFAWGGSALGPGAPIEGATPATLALAPSLITVRSLYAGPQDELATGPALPVTYGGPAPASGERFDVLSTVAAGQTIEHLTLSDPLPPSAVATSFRLTDGATVGTYEVDPATGLLTRIGIAGPDVVTDPAAATGPYVFWDAATDTVSADFGTVIGTGAADGGPSIRSYFHVGLEQGLGTATLRADSTVAPLVVTDMLPYGAVAQSFTLTGPDGVEYRYARDAAGTITLVGGDPASAPGQAASDAALTAGQYFYDVADGRIVADFGVPTAIGDSATVTARWSGGQYQRPGLVSGTGTGADLTLVDQLGGAAAADQVTLTTADGVATYHWDATAGLTKTGFVPAAAGGADTAPAPGTAASAGSTVYYDAANHRIVARLAGYAAGATATLAASATGGQTVPETTAQTYLLENGASATGTWTRIGAAIPATDAAPDFVTAKAITLQKSVVDATVAGAGGYHPVQPGDQLVWTLTAQVSNYFDLTAVAIDDHFSDGQHFDATRPVTLSVSRPGLPAADLTLAPGEYQLNQAADVDGSTRIVFDVSRALADAGLAADLNGGAAPDDVPPSTVAAPTLTLTYATVIDPTWKVQPAPGASYFLEQGDQLANTAAISGQVADARGRPTTVTASDGSGAGVSLDTGSVLKRLYAVTRDGVVLWHADAAHPEASYTGLVQTGDDVTYHLVYNLPITHAADVRLTDFLPLPIFRVDQPNGLASGGMPYRFDATATFAVEGTAGAPLPADGVIEYTTGATAAPYFAQAVPTLTTDTAANAFTIDFGAAQAGDAAGQTYPDTNVDLVYTTKVQDAAFGDGLQLTNQVTGVETNSLGQPTTSNDIAAIDLAAPKLRIEKAVVATTDAHGVFLGADGRSLAAPSGAVALGGVRWSLGGVAFAGTVTTAGLVASPVADTLTNIGAGETSRFALVVENTGHDSRGAFDVGLRDTPIPAGLTLVPGSVRVTDGQGHALAFRAADGSPDAAAALFAGGIAVTDNSGLPGRALAPLTNDGSNVLVVTYDLTTLADVATPLLALPDTASLTQFSEQTGGVNRLDTIPAGEARASSAIVTATPTLTKHVVATSGSASGADAGALHVGEAVTYDLVATLPGGTANGVTLADLLPPQLRLVSASLLSVGADVHAALAAGATSASGTFDLGRVAVATDARGTQDQVAFRVVALVDGAASITDAAGIVNTARLSEARPDGGTYTLDAAATIAAHTPSLSLVKTVRDDTTNPTGGFATHTDARAGDVLEFHVDLTDAAGAADAYQVHVADALTALGIGVDPFGASNLGLIADSLTVTGGTGRIDGNAVSAAAATLAAGQTLSLDFRAVVSSHARLATPIDNAAGYTAETLAASDPAYVLGAERLLSGQADATASLTGPPPMGTIVGRAFVNDACDGLYHIGDAAVGGVVVELRDASGALVGSATTDSYGNYRLTAPVGGTYTEHFALPAGLAFAKQGAGDPAISSAVDPATGSTAPFTLDGPGSVASENAALYLTGAFPGHGATAIGAGVAYSANTGGQVIVGAGADNVHTNAGDNVILIGNAGSDGADVVETGPGTDIVYTCGTDGTNAQALGVADFIFGGGGGGVLQGGSGADYLMAGPGHYTLAGGGGPSTLVGGQGGGTVTTVGGVVTGTTVGDEIRPGGGATTILFQAGDGVDLLDTFKPGHDSLTIYGYGAARSLDRVNGHTTLWLGGNDAIVFNDAYAADADGTLPGIAFVPTLPAAPTLTLTFGADGLPVLAPPGATPATSPNAAAALPTLAAAAPTGSLQGSGLAQRLIAGNGASFTLVGGDGQDVFVGGSGNDAIYAHGTANSATLGDGSNLLVGGTAQTTATAGNGGNTFILSGASNSVTAGNGNNVVLMTAGASGHVALGDGANLVFAYGGSGLDIEAGSGANTVFAQIDASTVHLGRGNVFLFGSNDTVRLDSPTGSVLAVQGSGDATRAGDGDLLLFQSGGTADVGAGSHQLYVSGQGVHIEAGGDNAILGPTGGASISVTGNGTQLIGLTGTGNGVVIAGGAATVFAGDGGDTLAFAGTGPLTAVLGTRDTVQAGQGTNALWLGAGGGQRVTLAAQSTSNDVYGFKPGDVLDLSRVLAGVHADLSRIAGFVTATPSGGDTLIGLVASGQAGGASTTIADLHGIAASLSQLVSGGELTFG